MPDVPLRRRSPLLPHTNHWDFTHKGNRAERVQTVNADDGGEVLQAGARDLDTGNAGFVPGSNPMLELSAQRAVRSQRP